MEISTVTYSTLSLTKCFIDYRILADTENRRDFSHSQSVNLQQCLFLLCIHLKLAFPFLKEKIQVTLQSCRTNRVYKYGIVFCKDSPVLFTEGFNIDFSPTPFHF